MQPLCHACIAAAILGLALGSTPSPTRDQRHALILWGGRPDLPANMVVNQATRTALYGEFGSDVDIRFEHVEESASQADEQPALRDFLRHKYASRRFDVLIAIVPRAVTARVRRSSHRPHRQYPCGRRTRRR